MRKNIKLIGNIAAILGILVCLVSGGARVIGQFYVAGFEAMTLFNVGVALMVAATLAKVHSFSCGR